jgi:formate dehydrogenase subunit delta
MTVLKYLPIRTESAGKRPPMSPDKLVYMANQIGKFFNSQSAEAAVVGTADHIKKFWDPRMRAAIFAYLDKGGAGLESNVREAIERLKSQNA